jgi:hypothetical protein
MDFTYKPQLTIELKPLARPTEVLDWMRALNIKFYTYSFRVKDVVLIPAYAEVIKYGASGDCHTGELGERLYRQAGHIPGWTQTEPWLVGSSGEDMCQILDDYNQAYKYNITKDDVVIDVWPMNNISMKDVKATCENDERRLINEHIAMHGIPPIGNKDHETNKQLRRYLNTNVLKHAVEFGD